MASQEVWNVTKIFFRYMSPINYIIVYDAKSRTIHRNTKQKGWFYSQVCLVIVSAVVAIYFVINSNAPLENNFQTTQSMVYMFAFLYGGAAGLYLIFTISVGFRGDIFYSCFNTIIKMQQKLQSNYA